jgi:cytochrome c peroxidase
MTSITSYIEFANRPKRVLLSTVALLGLFVVAPAMADKGGSGGGKGSDDANQTAHKSPVPSDAPDYFGPMYSVMMKVPATTGAKAAATAPAASSPVGMPVTVPQFGTDPNSLGTTGSYEIPGKTTTANNAFFQSLGTNGRSCFTCHQPASGMGLSVSSIAATAAASQLDPLFAMADGANCPGAVLRGDAFASSHSLLLTRGLFRPSMPVPLQTNDVKADGSPNPHAVEFTVKVLSDPNGCNTDPTYAQTVDGNGITRQMISFYRRPIMAGNLKAKTTTTESNSSAPTDPVTGQPIAIDQTSVNGFPGFTSGQALSGNIMWDGREPTFEHQAVDATMGHAQATQAPTPAQVAQIVAFETMMFNGQQTVNTSATPVDLSVGANGGPAYAAGVAEGVSGARAFDIFDGWRSATGTSVTDKMKESILRGQEVFNTKKFTISNVAGLNNSAGIDNPISGTCATCHNQLNAGSSNLPHGQKDIGIGGSAGGSNKIHSGPAPSKDLPIFQVTCKPGYSTAFNGTTVQTNDIGLAMISGHCADVGRFTTPTLRALASRAPYFSDGSANTLGAVLDFYKVRFQVNLSGGEHDDLLNFLASL